MRAKFGLGVLMWLEVALKKANVVPVFLIASCLCAFCGMAEPLRTIAEVRGLTAKEMDEQRPVELKGLVIARTFNGSIILQDETGNFIVEGQDLGEDPAAGEAIFVRGTTFLDHVHDIRQEYVLLKEWRKAGAGKRPPIPEMHAEDIVVGRANFKLARVKGVVIDAFPDEMDPKWN